MICFFPLNMSHQRSIKTILVGSIENEKLPSLMHERVSIAETINNYNVDNIIAGNTKPIVVVMNLMDYLTQQEIKDKDFSRTKELLGKHTSMYITIIGTSIDDVSEKLSKEFYTFFHSKYHHAPTLVLANTMHDENVKSLIKNFDKTEIKYYANAKDAGEKVLVEYLNTFVSN